MSTKLRVNGDFPDVTPYSNEQTIFGVFGDNSRMFPDFYQSVMIKALKVSPTIEGMTLGPNAAIHSSRESTHAVGNNEPPQEAITPRNAYSKISHLPLRRPKRRSIYSEVNSSTELEKKTLMAEMAKKQQRDADKKVIELENSVKNNDEKLHNDLTFAFSKIRLHQDAKKRIAEENLLKKFVRPIVTTDNEIEQATDSKVLERSEKVKQNVEDAKRKSAALQEQMGFFEVLSAWYKKYSSEYMKIVDTMKNCRDPKALQDKAFPYLNKLEKDVQITEGLKSKLSSYNLAASDINNAENLMKSIKAISQILDDESKVINDAVVEKEEADRKEKLLEEEKEKEALHAKDLATDTPTFVDMDSLNKFLCYTKHLSQVHLSLAGILNDTNFSQFRFELQKAVTLPVNAISPVSSAHMLDKYRKLNIILSGKANEAGKSSPETHPLGILFVKDLLAKLFVRQGEMSGSSKPESVFALASILVNLWVDFPDFGELVMAHFYNRCPYLAPVFLPQIEGQSDEDYYRSLGYLVTKGEIEKQDMFLKRMKGLMRLFAAILITKPRNTNSPNPLGLKEAWRWLAAILNLDPKPDICAVLILELLEVAGHDLLQVYRGQMRKLLAYLMSEYFTRLDQVTASTSRGPLTRLETFLSTAAKSGNIPEPAQRLSQSFW